MKNHFTWVNELPSLHDAALKKFGSEAEVAHQISLLRRRLKYQGPDRKSPFPLRGGPYDGQTLWLTQPCTGIFSVAGQRGHYAPNVKGLRLSQLHNVNELCWEELK